MRRTIGLLFVVMMIVSSGRAAGRGPGNLDYTFASDSLFGPQLVAGQVEGGEWQTKVAVRSTNFGGGEKYIHLVTVTADGNQLALRDGLNTQPSFNHYLSRIPAGVERTLTFRSSEPLVSGWLAMDEYLDPFVRGRPTEVEVIITREFHGPTGIQTFASPLRRSARFFSVAAFSNSGATTGVAITNVSTRQATTVNLRALDAERNIVAETSVFLDRQTQLVKFIWELFGKDPLGWRFDGELQVSSESAPVAFETIVFPGN